VTDRLTDHTTLPVTIGTAHSGEANFCYCLWLQCASLSPPESSMQMASRSLQPFLPGSLGDRPTDHTIRSLTIGRAHSGEAKFCCCLWLQQIFIGAVNSTDQINFSNLQIYKTRRGVAVYVETHYNIASKTAFPNGIIDR